MNVFGTRGWEEGEDRFEGSGRVVWGWVDRKSVGFVDDELERTEGGTGRNGKES